METRRRVADARSPCCSRAPRRGRRAKRRTRFVDFSGGALRRLAPPRRRSFAAWPRPSTRRARRSRTSSFKSNASTSWASRFARQPGSPSARASSTATRASDVGGEFARLGPNAFGPNVERGETRASISVRMPTSRHKRWLSSPRWLLALGAMPCGLPLLQRAPQSHFTRSASRSHRPGDVRAPSFSAAAISARATLRLRTSAFRQPSRAPPWPRLLRRRGVAPQRSPPQASARLRSSASAPQRQLAAAAAKPPAALGLQPFASSRAASSRSALASSAAATRFARAPRVSLRAPPPQPRASSLAPPAFAPAALETAALSALARRASPSPPSAFCPAPPSRKSCPRSSRQASPSARYLAPPAFALFGSRLRLLRSRSLALQPSRRHQPWPSQPQQPYARPSSHQVPLSRFSASARTSQQPRPALAFSVAAAFRRRSSTSRRSSALALLLRLPPLLRRISLRLCASEAGALPTASRRWPALLECSPSPEERAVSAS